MWVTYFLMRHFRSPRGRGGGQGRGGRAGTGSQPCSVTMTKGLGGNGLGLTDPHVNTKRPLALPRVEERYKLTFYI